MNPDYREAIDDYADWLNQRIADDLRLTGEAFVTTTEVRDNTVIRLSIYGHRTTLTDIERTFQALREHGERIDAADRERLTVRPTMVYGPKSLRTSDDTTAPTREGAPSWAEDLPGLQGHHDYWVDHALDETSKAKVAEEYLDALGIEASAHALPYDEFETQATEQPDVVLPLANERNVRSAIQHNRPPVMLHATTSGAEVAVRRHIPFEDSCLLCHFPPEEPEVDAGCATAPVSSESNNSDNTDTDAALPFASFLAGCFVAAELAKLPLEAYPPTDNLARVLTRADLGRMGVLQYEKGQPDDCGFCSNSSPSVHAGRIDGTRFDHLTDTNQS